VVAKRERALARPSGAIAGTDQLGHTFDVSQNVYTQSPVKSRLGMVNKLEKSLLLM
jgi:hypothetical protein